ncbi:MAG: hypothetical protein ACJ8G7_03855 [Rhizobacter sp.]
MLMQRFSAEKEEAFLHAEACELAVLSTEHVGCAAAGRKPKSVLHTLSVELSVLIGLDDRERLDRLVDEATQLLARAGRQDAITVLHATSSRLQGAASNQASNCRKASPEH